MNRNLVHDLHSATLADGGSLNYNLQRWCTAFVKLGNDFEHYGEEVTARYGAYGSRKYVHMHNDEGVMEMHSKMEPGKHYVQVYVDSGSTNEKGVCHENESRADDKQKGIADVQQGADDNVCEDSTDEEYIVKEESSESNKEESSESDGLSGDELGTDDEEYFEARRKRAASKKVANEETENFTLSSEKRSGRWSPLTARPASDVTLSGSAAGVCD
ncbi:magnesium transporter 7 [Striga asiatica]|uniref:Magnesium transporter 7 n=1 Tax=Striga asiatica TaxID=4170 RepID=A0A5A7PGL0_STRAF|nr:magnesium transporter 7 [Striga asiatica]